MVGVIVNAPSVAVTVAVGVKVAVSLTASVAVSVAVAAIVADVGVAGVPVAPGRRVNVTVGLGVRNSYVNGSTCFHSLPPGVKVGLGTCVGGITDGTGNSQVAMILNTR